MKIRRVRVYARWARRAWRLAGWMDRFAWIAAAGCEALLVVLWLVRGK